MVSALESYIEYEIDLSRTESTKEISILQKLRRKLIFVYYHIRTFSIL